VWLAARDGTELRQLTNNSRIEWGLAWAPDSNMLVYASADATAPAQPLTLPDWEQWSAWCSASEIRTLALASETETSFAPGCQPAVSPDGLRIAFATPPEASSTDTSDSPGTTNAIRLINNEGENGWNLAGAGELANAAPVEDGHLVYAPAWSPDNRHIAYQRFLGYRALVDINLVEMGNSFEGESSLLSSGAGWMLPPRVAPTGPRIAIIEHNFSDARGYSGYDVWHLQILNHAEAGEVFLPTGTFQADAAVEYELPRATAAAWAPGGNDLVVALPPGWSADISTQEPVFNAITPGTLWRWGSGAAPEERLVEGVDFGSPLLWLPPR
jgi:Tol biopolymer transport system component